MTGSMIPRKFTFAIISSEGSSEARSSKRELRGSVTILSFSGSNQSSEREPVLPASFLEFSGEFFLALEAFMIDLSESDVPTAALIPSQRDNRDTKQDLLRALTFCI